MKNKKTVHIISHSHWDREWYLPFEKHRMLLIELFDDLFYLFENDPGFDSFHLDGQTILIDDYLEIKPENKNLIEKYIKSGKLKIGPFYILQDDYLISSEAHTRNTLIGMSESYKWGEPVRLGYYPDTFGNMGQAPQMLKLSGLDTVAFGRGVKTTGFNNEVGDDLYATEFSEMWWKGSDGSEIFSILFANWYSNGNEIPTERKEAVKFWQTKLKEAEKYASTNQLLMMNGVDHQPIQKDVTEAIRLANELYPDYHFIHSNFEKYIDAVKKEAPSDLGSVQGELTSQETDGWYTLANTASSRIYLKQANTTVQTLLENIVEPLATMNAIAGDNYPHAELRYAWKTLLKNHPHDSICGCSVDEVHREMETRFEKAQSVSEFLKKETLNKLSDKIDTEAQERINFTVYNTYSTKRSGYVDIELEWERKLFTEGAPQELYEELENTEISHVKVINQNKETIDCDILAEKIRFNYDLPKDSFRVPYIARYLKIRVYLKDFDGLSWETFSVVETSETTKPSNNDAIGLENEFIKVKFNDNGKIDVLNKENNVWFENFFYYEDTGDIGNEYIYRQSADNTKILSTEFSSEYEVSYVSHNLKEVTMKQTLMLPASAAETLDKEQQKVIDIRNRETVRSDNLIPFEITTKFSLAKNDRMVCIETSFDNNIRDHRLRAIFDTQLDVNYHFAESVYEVIERPNIVSEVWEKPDNPQRMQAFMNMRNNEYGVTLANFGLPEYEVVDKRYLALTLVRSVREMGDWGYFPTPEAQCQGAFTAQFGFMFNDESNIETTYHRAKQFQVPFIAHQNDVHKGSISSKAQFIAVDGEDTMMTALKKSEDDQGVIMRFYNMCETDSELNLNLDETKISVVNLMEEKLNESFDDKLDSHEIKTLKLEMGDNNDN